MPSEASNGSLAATGRFTGATESNDEYFITRLRSKSIEVLSSYSDPEAETTESA
jgi:hypothetical protein